MTAAEGIWRAMTALGGERSIDEVREWLAANIAQTWSDLGTSMADLTSPGNASSGYAEEQRFLERVATGRYRLRQTGTFVVGPPTPPAPRTGADSSDQVIEASTSSPHQPVFVILRADLFHSPDIELESMITAKEVVRDQTTAEREVERLNALRPDGRVRYWCAYSRLFPEGRSAGAKWRST